jgi:hypothetical protein
MEKAESAFEPEAFDHRERDAVENDDEVTPLALRNVGQHNKRITLVEAAILAVVEPDGIDHSRCV